MTGAVNKIIESMTARVSKAGKPYDAMKVELELDTGEIINVLSFDEVALGDVLPVEKNGEYFNIVKPKRGQAELTQILEKLDSIEKKLNKLVAVAPQGLDFAKAQADRLRTKADIDEVFDPDEPSK